MTSERLPERLLSVALPLILVAAPTLAEDDIPRTPEGRPDLTGTYDIATLTPLERPQEFGENLYLSEEEAHEIMEEHREFLAQRSSRSDPNRGAPPEGGAPPAGVGEEFRGRSGAGEVGGYNDFWVDRGDSVIMVDGKFRTSIITDPANGRRPPMTPEARRALGKVIRNFRGPEDTAFWLDFEGPGPYDGPETRTLSDRCLASFSSTVPALPSLYNNIKRIVQSGDRVMILNEMVHDARVVRIGGEHPPEDVRFWFGDSVGWWEGDTLVVETTNFKDHGFFGPTETYEVTERFTREDADTLHYAFTVEDPSRWTAPWSGDFTWPITEDKVYEYACHEGNYAMKGMLEGARLLERETLEQRARESAEEGESDQQ